MSLELVEVIALYIYIMIRIVHNILSNIKDYLFLLLIIEKWF